MQLRTMFCWCLHVKGWCLCGGGATQEVSFVIGTDVVCFDVLRPWTLEDFFFFFFDVSWPA